MGANHVGEMANLCAIAEPTCVLSLILEELTEGFDGIEGVKKGKGELFDFLRLSKTLLHL